MVRKSIIKDYSVSEDNLINNNPSSLNNSDNKILYNDTIMKKVRKKLEKKYGMNFIYEYFRNWPK
jgi:glucan phosphoethanolaminetransferase (alkaline phosphatase superfamily)